ncbi:BRO-N domain-containing protein [Saccharomonospora cyanea]|uniref:Prophage antirepressor n=1 Tax=Saccharomonospora cyanea NA-134 TaxID=882082 RepID=H5XEX9_9PSEU|nr:BRO family protein [Saccharomonospora cyanea]EHR60373.1 prophage antirepressor [Saccharomonospora cyanea NA-134]
MKTFNFKGLDFRVIERGGDPWFVAKDVCDVLGIRSDTVRAVLDADEVAETNPNSIGVASGGRNPLIINEPGLYSLILRSRKERAREFKRWVTHEVLPAIRQTENYVSPGGEGARHAPRSRGGDDGSGSGVL